MDRKSHIDALGAMALTGFSVLLAFNQVVIKVTNGGFGPVFGAGARSLIALGLLYLWMRYRGIRPKLTRRNLGAGLLVGMLFAGEFICLYLALDLTTVSRSSVIFYSMPVWLAIAAHFLLDSERLTPTRMVGLVLAMGGVGVAMLDREGGTANIWGDLAALGAALLWGGIALSLRLTRMKDERPEMQLFWQLVISTPVLLLVSPLFGDLLRDPELIHVGGLLFQALAIASFGYLFWFFLLTVYPASSVASFSFLAPVFSVLFGWWLLGEQVAVSIFVALVLVALGLTLINRKPRA